MQKSPDSDAEYVVPSFGVPDAVAETTAGTSRSPLTAMEAHDNGSMQLPHDRLDAHTIPSDVRITRAVGMASIPAPGEDILIDTEPTEETGSKNSTDHNSISSEEAIGAAAQAKQQGKSDTQDTVRQEPHEDQHDRPPTDHSGGKKPPIPPDDMVPGTGVPPEEGGDSDGQPSGDSIVPVPREALSSPADKQPSTQEESPPTVTDPKLAALLQQGLQSVGESTLSNILHANQRFDNAHTVVDVQARDGTITRVSQYTHRRLLATLPNLVQAAQDTQMTSEQLSDLVTHTLNSVNYPTASYSDVTVVFITNALRASADSGEAITPEMTARLQDMITKAGQNDVIEESLAAYRATRKAGLSMEQGLELIHGHLDTANYRQLGYMMYHFTRALETLDSAGIAPEDTTRVFKAVEGLHPEFRGEVYDRLRKAIIFDSPAEKVTPAVMMQRLGERLQEAIQHSHDQPDQILATPERTKDMAVLEGSDMTTPAQHRDTFFREIPGRLENRATPYRTERSWKDGMEDIRRLTHGNSRLGDIVDEGRWAFVPENGTWYSHGGETKSDWANRWHTHASVLYDISALAPRSYHVHIHPEALAIGVDRFSFAFPTSTDFMSIAHMLGHARDPVEEVRSFISHPLGYTEFTYPHNPERVKEFAESYEALTQSVFGRFPTEDALIATAIRRGEQAFIRSEIAAVNALLPEGFSLKFYSLDTNWDEL